MDEKDLVEGMREYISLLKKEGRYSSAKSYQDAMNSFIRYSGTDRIPYTYINKDTLRRSNFKMKSLKHFAGMPCYRYSSVFFMVLDF